MASLNLSLNGPSISKSYQSVVDYSMPPTASSSTYGKWAIFSVSTPLMSAFQQNAANKESVLKVQDTGEGDLTDLLDEFSEGKIQFAFVKVTDPNSGLPKNILIAWCGEGVPERTKGYFTSHLSTVSKFLHGYHVQITARSEKDLTAEGIIKRVGDASGAKYTPSTEQPTTSVPKPPVSSKPVFNPLRTGGTSASTKPIIPIRSKPSVDDDGWGPDAPPVTRTNLEKVQPAYRPTRVNMQELKSERPSETTTNPHKTNQVHADVVKGGYQPVGKVDIAAIRRQAREAGTLKDDRPEPVKGAYEPVGKVDIAAIRSKAQPLDSLPVKNKENSPSISENGPSIIQNDGDFNASNFERLTSLPKPKISNKFSSVSTVPTATRPPVPSDDLSKSTSTAQIGSASRTFADEGGKTPAQIWAEKKARERGQESKAAVSSNITGSTPLNQQGDRSEWKSSYSGKTWAPVQTTHTGKSMASSSSNQATGLTGDSTLATESATPQHSVSSMREQFSNRHSEDSHEESPENELELSRGPPPTHAKESIEPEVSHEPEFYEAIPSQPQETRSPTPPSPPARETSPIRVAMPVSSGAPGTHAKETTSADSLEPVLPNDKDFDDGPQDVNLDRSDITPDQTSHHVGIRAIVQYDYDKAEPNEIDLKEGEQVTEIDMVDKDWWFGLSIRGERGLFPSNYVELVEDNQNGPAEPDVHELATPPAETDHDALPSIASDKPIARALYDYEAAEENEISFPEGAEITNIEFPDDDWWFGEYLNKKGLFPANYVQLED